MIEILFAKLRVSDKLNPIPVEWLESEYETLLLFRDYMLSGDIAHTDGL